jgi:hypothetical protein
MKLHIGKEIERRYKESGIKLSEFARRLNTSPRNVYAIFDRSDIKTDLLQKIGEVLNFNFLSLYHTMPGQVKEPNTQYGLKSTSDTVSIIVVLDGHEATLNENIKKLTAINRTLA